MRSLPVIGMSLAAITILAACTTSSSSSGSSSGSPVPSAGPAGLDGHTYVSTSVSGHDLVAGSTVTLTFQGGHLGANAGCNSLAGGYEVTNGKLSVGQMASTMMACPDPLMAQDTWLAAFLDGAAVTQSGDNLTLAKDGVTMQLVDKRTTNLPLENTTWTVDGLISSDAISSVPIGVTATLVFAGGKVAVDTGCNTGSGPATATATTITFGADRDDPEDVPRRRHDGREPDGQGASGRPAVHDRRRHPQDRRQRQGRADAHRREVSPRLEWGAPATTPLLGRAEVGPAPQTCGGYPVIRRISPYSGRSRSYSRRYTDR